MAAYGKRKCDLRPDENVTLTTWTNNKSSRSNCAMLSVSREVTGGQMIDNSSVYTVYKRLHVAQREELTVICIYIVPYFTIS